MYPTPPWNWGCLLSMLFSWSTSQLGCVGKGSRTPTLQRQSPPAPINGPHCSQPRTSLRVRGQGKGWASASSHILSRTQLLSTCGTLTTHSLAFSFIVFPKHMDWLLFLLLPGVLLVLCESPLKGECHGRDTGGEEFWNLGVVSWASWLRMAGTAKTALDPGLWILWLAQSHSPP